MRKMLLAVLLAGLAGCATKNTSVGDPPTNTDTPEKPQYIVEKPAQGDFADLWEASFSKGVEMMECVAVQGTQTMDSDTVRIVGTSEQRWEGTAHAIGEEQGAEILSFCSPPEWDGTIHTHPNDAVTVMGRDLNERFPYLTTADLGALAAWANHHEAVGLWCVISDSGEAGVRCSRASPPSGEYNYHLVGGRDKQ